MRWVVIGLILGHSAWCADILSPNEAVRRSLEPNAIHEYSLPGSADTYLVLEVDRQGARLEVEAGSIRRRLAGADMQPAIICWASTDAAPTILRIRSLESKAVRPYGLRLVSRVASAADQARVRGCRFLAEEKLQDALREFEAAGDWARQGETLTLLGQALWDLGKTSESVAAHEKAVAAWDRAHNPGRKAAAMYRLAVGYGLLNRREEGRKTLRAAASLAHEALATRLSRRTR